MCSKIRNLFIVACILTAHGRGSYGQEQYVTRFENRPKLTYYPRVQMVERAMAKGSWNPFAKSIKMERKLVPVVTWVPKWTNETLPVTEKLTPLKPESPELEKTHWVARSARRVRPSELAIDRPPTTTLESRSIVLKEPQALGGVQKMDDNLPRLGMKIREIRQP